jgi:hypothetical protein
MSVRGFACTSLLLGVGCTAIRVQPVEPAATVKHVCIQDNPKVIVTDFLPVVIDGFARHGISTEVYSGQTPEGCEFVLTYTARRSWDFAPYLSHAELRLESKGRQVAYAEYHLRGKGGYSLMKWQGTKKKMDPVIDELLAAY